MKLGLGLYRHMLNTENFRFAKQAGCTHIIVHLADYFKEILPATNETVNYGTSAQHDPIWEEESMKRLQKMAQDEGLTIYGIENFSPADWYDILLDGPKKDQQLENCKRIIQNAGKAGIHSFGYNFSLAGVWGHQKLPVARGSAISSCFCADNLDITSPIPLGEVWNMTYNPNAAPGFLAQISYEELWSRLKWFLERILPVAEEAGVAMALHPDDPPMPMLRGTPRLIYQPYLYQKLIDLNPSLSNQIELCMGSIQEMTDGNIYDTIEKYLSQNRVSYMHFRNVIGKVPNYKEVFIDEGDIDMLRAMTILSRHNFAGVIVPDHTPQMEGSAPWHEGMAYALGYMKMAMEAVERGEFHFSDTP